MPRVLIADDVVHARPARPPCCRATPASRWSARPPTGARGGARAQALAVDVVLMDVRMPDLDGINATRELTRAAPGARILILTTFEQDDYIFGGLRAGASGFLLKRTRPEELIAAVHDRRAATRCCLRRSPGG